MATARYQHSATLLPNGQVLVAGGFTTGSAPIASAELYTPASFDGGSGDAGPSSRDGGSADAGASANDSGFTDGGSSLPDSGVADAGGQAPRTYAVGCDCNASPAGAWILWALVAAAICCRNRFR